MAENTKIEWADATVNWWAGCTAVSPACDHCYAERMSGRLWGTQWGSGQQRQRFDGAFKALEALDRKARRLGRPLRVFHNSLSDFFDNEVPENWRIDALSAMEQTPNLIHLLLTKRIGNVAAMLPWSACSEPESNVWIGATIVNQAEADRDVQKLLAVPAAKRFLSMEPLLGQVDLTGVWRHWNMAACEHGELPDVMIDWVIVGGESGPGARPMHPDWARSLRDQCQAAGVPFLFKQWGEWLPGQNEVHPYANGRKVAHHQDDSWGETDTKVNASNYVTWDATGEMRIGSLLDDTTGFRVHAWAERVGKKSAGRLLDGRPWDEVPE